MNTFTFFDLIAALRNKTTLRFTTASSAAMDEVTTVGLATRSGRIWALGTSNGLSYIWDESNSGGTVITVV